SREERHAHREEGRERRNLEIRCAPVPAGALSRLDTLSISHLERIMLNRGRSNENFCAYPGAYDSPRTARRRGTRMIAFRYLVTDVERAMSFYVGLLGFKLVKQFGPVFAEVELGGVSVWLSGPETSAARPMPDGRKPTPGGWNRAVVIVENLEIRVEELKAAGVTFRNTILSGPGGSQ